MRLSPSKIAFESPPPAPSRLRPGDYLRADRTLYCIEQLGEVDAVLEDCRTGELVHVSLAELGELELVRRSRR